MKRRDFLKLVGIGAITPLAFNRLKADDPLWSCWHYRVPRRPDNRHYVGETIIKPVCNIPGKTHVEYVCTMVSDTEVEFRSALK